MKMSFFRSIFSVHVIVIVPFLVIFSVFTSVSYGLPNMGYVTGNVTVFQKKLFGKLKKKKDMSGVLVYITGFKSKELEEIPDIVQKDRKFSPDFLTIVAGQKVRFLNHDEIYHNVFSISPIKSFDLGQYKGKEPPKLVTFEKPGLVPVFCNIHPEMIAYVVVLENNAYAMTDKDGTFQMRNVPIGTYTINAWLSRAKRVSREVVVQPGQETKIHLEIKEILKITPHQRKDGSEYPTEIKDYEDELEDQD